MMTTTPIQRKLPLTVLVLCGNEERNIDACLESVAGWAAELLVVVDASSTDRTEDLARRHTDRVLRHHYENYATQQNWSIPQAGHEWVFVLDADERVTPGLRDSIARLFEAGLVHDGYWIQRANYLLGKEVRHSGWGNERVLRLFRRDSTRYQQKRVHAKADIADTGVIDGRIIHYSINSIQSWVAKINRYSTWKSQDKFERDTPLPYLQLLLRPPYRFFKDYVMRMGILDGWRGFMIAVMSSFAEFIMTAKVIEYRWRRDQGDSAGPSMQSQHKR